MGNCNEGKTFKSVYLFTKGSEKNLEKCKERKGDKQASCARIGCSLICRQQECKFEAFEVKK